MKILKNISIAVAALLAIIVVVGLFLPSTAHVERSAVISVNPSVLFKFVNDFRQFNRWSPWAKYDPNTEYTFEGPPAGVGAKMSWRSEDPNVGSGRQEIIESEPDNFVKTHLDFGNQGTATAFYKLEPVREGTRLTWGFDTAFGYNLLGRYFGLMFDKWIGADYEKGLANLKSLAGSPSTTQTPESK